MKVCAFLLSAVGVLMIVIQGEFNNDFIRILLLLITCAFIFYANVYWVLRLIVSGFPF